MRILDKQDLHDILYGCTVLGTGGGGSLEKGIELVDGALSQGKTFRLAALEELADDAWIGVPYMCGALTHEGTKIDLPVLPETMPLRAFRTMEVYLGQKFQGVLSTELGGGNTAEAFYVAAMLDLAIVDADPAGRSVPALSHSTFCIHDVPIYPIAVADAYGNTAILPHTASDERAEAWVRALAVASNNSVGVVDHPGTAAQMRGKLIEGAISYALKVGRALRLAAPEDAAAEIVCAGGGCILFEGTVDVLDWETKDGFTFGNVSLLGDGGYAGHTYKIWFQNENIISWLDGEIHATVPELICMIDRDTKLPLQNPFIPVDGRVAVFALPAPEMWTTPRGLALFGPRWFGYDREFKPVIGK